MDGPALIECLGELVAHTGQTSLLTGRDSALRVDIDTDIGAAGQLADALDAAGFTAQWFLLHTAGYWCWSLDGVVERHECMADDYRRLDRCGSVGLHVDPFGIAADQSHPDHDDAAGAMLRELNWLRSLNIDVTAISAHNAAPLHGGENYELFREWHHGSTHPLAGTIVAADHGLTRCSGNPSGTAHPDAAAFLDQAMPDDPLRDEQWMRRYLHQGGWTRWRVDQNIWLIGDDRWVLSRPSDDTWMFDRSWSDLIAQIDRSGSISVTVHPIYTRWAR